MNVGERIAEEREKLGFNQEGFGLIGGVKKNAQFQYEKGIRSPSADYLAAIAGAGADVAYILTGSRLQDALDFSPIKQAALQAHKAANAMGKVTDKQFLGIFTAMLDGVVDASDKADDKNDTGNTGKSVVLTSNSSGTVQIGGNNSGTVNNDPEGRKRK